MPSVAQAVLEHVLDPWRCVEELHRVLASGGLVYAETPFMQQVHEGRFDFTRFTHLGHRRLFRRFEELDSGAVGGPGMALAWSWRYFLWSFARGPLSGSLLTTFASFTSFFSRPSTARSSTGRARWTARRACTSSGGARRPRCPTATWWPPTAARGDARVRSRLVPRVAHPACYSRAVVSALVKAPLFPLPDGALLPGELLSLHVFEPRYRAMLDDARKGSPVIAIATLLPGWEADYAGAPAVADIVGLGRMVDDRPQPDGTSDIVLQGMLRAEIATELDSDKLYRLAGLVPRPTRPCTPPRPGACAVSCCSASPGGCTRAPSATT
jgi:hypothetical protein